MRVYVIKTTIKTIEQTTINRKWGKIIKEIYTKLLGTKYKFKKKKIDEEHVTSGILELCSICKSTEMVRLNMVCKGKMRNGF